MSEGLADTFALSPGIDWAAARATYGRTGRVAIEPFLDARSAALLRDHLAGRADWRLVMNAGEKVYEMDRAGYAALGETQRATLDAKVAEAARHGFQYRYEAIRVDDEAGARAASRTPLDAFAAFMTSPAVLDRLAALAGAPIDLVDAQATLYGPGHFLTRHDDDVAGKGRSAAYVLGLTEGWRDEWGGLLLFHGAEGEIDHGFAPRFNALRLFAVPASHSVSPVWPHAPMTRLSVTGWLRRTAS